MFATELGSVSGESATIYLRPETAQGIFVNFLNVQKSARMKIPGIAQTGKAFRNGIVARQFIFRMREFEQMEMQFFVRPGTEMEWYTTSKDKRIAWHRALGLPAENYRFHDHIKLAHYANAACDIEFKFPMGFKELEDKSTAARTSTCAAMSSTAAASSSTSTPRPTRATCLTWWRPRWAWIACSWPC